MLNELGAATASLSKADPVSINSFRFFAVVAVVVMHFSLVYDSAFLSGGFASLTLIGRGDIGVAGFFLLSGYLLTIKWIRGEKPVHNMILERTVRLIIPFIFGFFLLYIVFAVGAGPYGAYASRMGYAWGLIVPIGMLETLSASDTLSSFINQLMGQNDNLILSAWTMRHELRAVGILITIVAIVKWCFSSKYQRGPWRLLRPLCLLLAWVGVLTFFRDGYGILDAFALGSVIAAFKVTQAQSVNGSVRTYLLFPFALSSFLAMYGAIVFMGDVTIDDLLSIGLAGEDSWWTNPVLYLLTDMRYFVSAVFCLTFVPVLVVIGSFKFVRNLLAAVSKMSYTIYLVHCQVLMLHVLLMSFVPVPPSLPVLIATYVSLLIIVTILFFLVIEKPSYVFAKYLEKRI